MPIATVVACGAVSEGAAADWAGLYLRDRIGTSEAAATGFALFAAAMAGGRFAGARVLARLGRVQALRASGLFTATGAALFVVAPNAPAALTAVVLWGLGAALVIPMPVTAAGELSSRPADAIAAVSTAGYGGFMAWPALVGLLAGAVGLGGALLAVSLLGVVVAALATAAGGQAVEPPAAVVSVETDRMRILPPTPRGRAPAGRRSSQARAAAMTGSARSARQISRSGR